jgi:hypothetical protein
MTDEREAMREALLTGRSVREALTEYAAPLPEAPESVAWCGASMRADFARAVPHIGPCVLRAGHDGPVHQDADGRQWTGPRPATAGDAAALCPPDPHPYVHLTYGPWQPSGHQCGDIQQGGCGDVIPERRVGARFGGVGEEHFVGWDLGDCPSCGLPGSALAPNSFLLGKSSPAPTLREQLADALQRHTEATGLPTPFPPDLPEGPWLEAARRANEARADAVLPVVEAALTRAEQRYKGIAEGLAIEARHLVRLLAQTEDELVQQRARAEKAERRVEHFEEHAAQINADLGIETQRAEQAEATLTDIRRMAQLWVDMRPTHPTITRDGHTIAYAGEQILARLDQPEATP